MIIWGSHSNFFYTIVLEMGNINKYQTLVILMAIGLGLLIGQNAFLEKIASYLIVPFLMIMLYVLFLAIPLNNLKENFFNLKFIVLSTFVNFLFTPLLAYILGVLFLSHNIALWMGFVMLLVTPCTDWYIVFTSLAKGNIALATSILPLNLIVQVIMLPFYIFLFFNHSAVLPLDMLLKSIILMVILPLSMAYLTRKITSVMGKMSLFNQIIMPKLDNLQIFFLSIAIIAMFASEGKYLMVNPGLVYELLIPLLLFFSITFVVGQLIGRWNKLNYADTVSLTFTTLARNSPIALAIAMVAFPHTPIIALALILGPLIELPILIIVSQSLLWLRKYKG